MKIALTTTGDALSSPLESRFGRASRFLVYDLEADTFEIVDNMANRQAAQGAGIQAAQAAVNSGVNAVITGHCGPKAFQVLQAAQVQVYPCTAATIEQAIAQYRAGELQLMGSADVAGHWS